MNDNKPPLPSPATSQQRPHEPAGNHPAIPPLVAEDIMERHRFGVTKYGYPLRADTGQDMLTHAYQESLDQANYLRAEIYRRDHLWELQEAVKAFHERFQQPVGDPAAPELSEDRARFRARLILEEAIEVCHALGLTRRQVETLAWEAAAKQDEWPVHQQPADIPAAYKELADVLFVAAGTAVETGPCIYPAFREVARANLSKTPGVQDAGGKQGKGPDYRLPDITAVLAKQIEEAKRGQDG